MADMKTDRLPRTRTLAHATGAKMYYTGEPCSRGHIAPRRTGNGTCTACEQATSSASTPVRKVADADRAWRLGQIRQGIDVTTLCLRLAGEDANAKPAGQRNEREVEMLALASAPSVPGRTKEPAFLAAKARWMGYAIETYTRLAAEEEDAEALSDMLALS